MTFPGVGGLSYLYPCLPFAILVALYFPVTCSELWSSWKRPVSNLSAAGLSRLDDDESLEFRRAERRGGSGMVGF
ncbi:unnamed protein product [Brassica oleracea var. botrytis]|uniref:(rape) hypothetical protein n=1 Tax=Brassica napus TaxID=3708 RepID=A0A816KL58_BRANA|nr:unnamed protein product [Brassica napus]